MKSHSIALCTTVAVVLASTLAPGVSLAVSDGPILDQIRGSLVTPTKKDFVPYDDSSLDSVKYLVFYFSAGWCGPCRAFTPDLVKFYKKKKSPTFEIILVGNDKSAEDMAEYMLDERMAWPALRYDQPSAASKYAGNGIPHLVIVDAATGDVLSSAYVDGEYRGPKAVLKDLEDLLKDEGGSGSGSGSSSSSFDEFFKKPGPASTP